MTENIQVLPARNEHASILTQISIASKRHWKYPEAWIQTWLPLLTITPEYIAENETWVGVVETDPVAFYSLKQVEGDLWLDHLWVLPDYMARGIGKILFKHALERSRLQGVKVLKIEADPNALGFYEKMGALKIDELRSEMDQVPRILPIMEIKL